MTDTLENEAAMEQQANEAAEAAEAVESEQPEKEKSKKPKTRAKVGANKRAKEVPMQMIISNKYNPDPARLENLAEEGYVLFPCDKLEAVVEEGETIEEGTPDDHVLSTLAFGNAKQRKLFTNLIEEHEPEVAELGESMHQSGQLHAVGVKPANREKTEFHLVYGCRRFFALAYIRAKLGVAPGKINAEIQSCNEREARIAAISENVHRKGVSKIREAEAVLQMNQSGKSHKDIAREMGWSQQTVKNKLDLAKAPEEIKKRVEKGTLGITRATEISRDLLNGGDGKVGKTSRTEEASKNGGPKRRTSLPWKQVAAIYDSCWEGEDDEDQEAAKEFYTEVRRILFPVLRYSSLEEADKESVTRLKEAAKIAEAKAEAEEGGDEGDEEE